MKVVGATGYVYYPVKKREARILKTIRRKVIWHWEKIRIRKAVVKNWPSILAILAMSQMYRFSFFQEPDMNFCLTTLIAVLMLRLLSRIQDAKAEDVHFKRKERPKCRKAA